MKNEVKIYANDEFGKVRVVTIDGEPWFVGRDIARVLGYANPNDALAKRVDEEDKGVAKCDTLGGIQDLVVINESGLYSLILSSKLPTAKTFKRWVTSEILPSVRKYGAYATADTIDKILSDPDFGIKLLTTLKEEKQKNKELSNENELLKVENESQAQMIAELNPKATYYDEVLKCVDAVPITIIAKDYGFSGKQMNNFLRDHKIQYKIRNTWLLYKEYQDKGFTKSETYWFQDNSGNNYSNIITKWTQKGRLFIYELMKNNGVLPIIEREKDS